MNFCTINLGCKVNAYELDCLKEEMLSLGHEENLINPDVIFINTCSVTHLASHKSKQKISSLRTKFPQSIIVAMGCFIEENKKEKKCYEKADIVLGCNDKNKAIECLKNFMNDRNRIVLFSKPTNKYVEFNSFSHNTRHRTYLKIQDGCINFCSYCLIPFLRQGLQSRDKDKIFNEVKFLKDKNIKEIVLSGIHVGVYGREKKDNYFFNDLLKELLEKFPDINFRLSSLEISEVNEQFFELFVKYKNLMPYLHIPLQSGSDDVLKSMNRKYNVKQYLDAIEKARKSSPNICISSDVIVGYPTETEKDFDETIRTLKRAQISFLHVFPFSPRKGTKAFNLKDLDSEVKKERSRKLLNLSNLFLNRYQKGLIGKHSMVLIEKFDKKNNVFYGTTNEYLDVKLKGDYKIGDYVDIIYKSTNFLTM